MNPGDTATRQEVRLGGPPTRTGEEDISWPDQVAPRGRKASSTRKIRPQTSNGKPQPRKAGQKRHLYDHTHHQPRSPERNTRTANPNRNRRDTGATRTHRQKPQAPARNAGRQANTQARACAKPKPQTRKSQRKESPRPRDVLHTTVGNTVSKARTLSKPVPCR